MRILYDHQMFALQRFGGITRIFIELMKGLAGRPGVEIAWHRGWHVDQYEVTGFAPGLQAYAATEAAPGGEPAAERPAVNRALFEKFAASLGTVDLYHPSYYEAATVQIPRRRRLILTVADLIAEKYFQDLPRFRPLLDDRRRLILEADCLQVISESTRRDLLEHYPVDPKKIRLTYLASDIASIPEAPAPVLPERPFFLYVGTRSKYKNFDVLLRAFAASPELARNFSVVSFGGTGDYNEPELKFMEAHGLRGAFTFVQGDDSLLKAYYRRAAALVYTSRYEGFGLPPLEAMECGCPVICAPTSSLPEVVGDAAALFNPDSAEELAAALLALAGQAELRTRLIRAGYERAGRFTWRNTVENTLAIYREVAA